MNKRVITDGDVVIDITDKNASDVYREFVTKGINISTTSVYKLLSGKAEKAKGFRVETIEPTPPTPPKTPVKRAAKKQVVVNKQAMQIPKVEAQQVPQTANYNPRIARRFKIVPKVNVAQHKGRYGEFLSLISKGIDTPDQLVSELGNEHKGWVQNTICKSKFFGHIRQINTKKK